jgi:nucleotide-binding universal stress UspA family protein
MGERMMAIRVLLTPLFPGAESERALDAAFVLARRFQSHVDALLVQRDPADAIPLAGEGVSADTIRRLMESAAEAMEEQRQATKAMFDHAVAAAGINRIEDEATPSGQPSAAFREAVGASEEVVPERALLSDLVVFSGARSETAPSMKATFEAVLLKSRQPILLAPAESAGPIGHNVAIAWNSTPEARNALGAAMPFLENAVAVHLLIAASARTDADAVDRARDYLAWHGIGSEVHIVEADDEPVGAALTHEASAIGADLLVMGGYGHTRLRERILGGVTHHIVNRPELPILLAH